MASRFDALTMIDSYEVLTSAEVRFLTEYAAWCGKAKLAEKLEAALQKAAYLGTFADETAANLSNHPGLAVGQFVPGDRYRDTGASKFKTNTATTVGAATWTADS